MLKSRSVLLVLICLLFAPESKANRFTNWLSSCARLAGLKADYFPLFAGQTRTYVTYTSTVTNGKAEGAGPFTQKIKYIGKVTHQGKNCHRQDVIDDEGNSHPSYWYEAGDFTYSWSETEKGWSKTTKDPQPKDGLSWTSQSWDPQGKEREPTRYSWHYVGTQHVAETGANYEKVFKMRAEFQQGKHVVETYYAPGIGYFHVESHGTQTVSGPEPLVIENTMKHMLQDVSP